MNKKLFLTSMLVLGVTGPVFAEPANTSNSFPGDGLMQEDYTYVGQANSTNMAGVYNDGATVYANAEYEWISLNAAPGEYLPQGATSVASCTAGNFCLGMSGIHYDNTQDQGLTACSTLGDNTYTQSAVGASAETDCYKACTTANVLHSSAVTGNDYYGAGTDTCEATACVNGYHIESTPDLATIIGNTTGTDTGFQSIDGNEAWNADIYGTTHNGEFVVDYGNTGKLHGYAKCSTTGVANPWFDNNSNTFESDHFKQSNELSATSGKYCWCMLDGYTPLNGSMQSLSSPWVFSSEWADASECESSCANDCSVDSLSYNFPESLAFRAAIFGTIQPSAATCEANTINIVWNHATQQDIDANNASMCVYDGDIRTPAAAETITGKTFTGWRFSTTQSQD